MTRHHRHVVRERRFHYARQALGQGPFFEAETDVAAEAERVDPGEESHDGDVTDAGQNNMPHTLARRGLLYTCLTLAGLFLLAYHSKSIVAVFYQIAHSWPNKPW